MHDLHSWGVVSPCWGMIEAQAGALQAARWGVERTYPDADRCAPHAVLSAECASAGMEVSGGWSSLVLVMTYYLACCDTSCFLTSLRSEAPYLRAGSQHLGRLRCRVPVFGRGRLRTGVAIVEGAEGWSSRLDVAGCRIDKRGSVAGVRICRRSTQHRTPSTGLAAPGPVASITNSLSLARDPSSQFRSFQDGVGHRWAFGGARFNGVVKRQSSSRRREPRERKSSPRPHTLCRTARGSAQVASDGVGGIDFTYLAGNADLLRALGHVDWWAGSLVLISRSGRRRWVRDDFDKSPA